MFEGEEDVEEQLRPYQRRRTSPRHPSTKVIVVSPSLPSTHSDAPKEHLPLEIQEFSESTLAALEDKKPAKNSGPSWLQLGFKMPTEAEALRDLVDEISSRTPLLNNIRFTNHLQHPISVVQSLTEQ